MELLCLRLVRKRLLSASAFLVSGKEEGLAGKYREPNEELTFARFAHSLTGHVSSVLKESN